MEAKEYSEMRQLLGLNQNNHKVDAILTDKQV
jgi:hypothetical protein